MRSMAHQLVQMVIEYDNGSRHVSIDQYDDALEQLVWLADLGDQDARDYLGM